jgi:hypothetical protein
MEYTFKSVTGAATPLPLFAQYWCVEAILQPIEWLTLPQKMGMDDRFHMILALAC